VTRQSALSVVLNTRVEPELREQLEQEAARQDRKAAELQRRYLREGLERDRAERGESRRV
jgi:hypothetical protein